MTDSSLKRGEVAKQIKRKLGARRRDLEVAVDGDTRPACDIWLRSPNWGRHHSTNRLQDARIVFGLGDFPVSFEDLEAKFLGQLNTDTSRASRRHRLTGPGRDRLQDSYCVTKLLQLAGRGLSRQLENGKAREMIFAFTTARCTANRRDPKTGQPLQSTVELLHRVAMPGSRLESWEVPERLQEAKQRSQDNLDRANAARAESSGALDVFDRYMRPKIETGEVTEFAARHARGVFGIPGERQGGRSGNVMAGALRIYEERPDVTLIETEDRGGRKIRSFRILPF